ncbi:glycerate kinase [Hydrogenophaga sp. PBL-H3]|uniref:glycerate kinase n=1 Tax=Hydrogenophaga sp. PBL-H3 TaxID=434010 RepID=UPI00131F870D|nr:glycerate kinase [Hydrogenophaga sp. PBL-H3]QHE78128.1 glycerate kinase [Hydrogenophaga sp. PBL-H3]QHE82553.1 glycerate kinase [Hydrogenophaga sp. PBL-H3]
MQLQKFLVPLGCAALLVLAHRSYGWPGVAAVGGGLMMWLLLHFTRLMTVLKRAAHRPIGHVDSAVMLNAKLKAGVTLMHVIAMTRALGERMSAEGAEPEVYRWTDGGHSTVEAEFRHGKLVRWQLARPDPEAPALPSEQASPAP